MIYMKDWKEEPGNYRPVVLVLEDTFLGGFIKYLPDEMEVSFPKNYHPDFTPCLISLKSVKFTIA